MTINFEQDRVESVTQIDAAKTLSDKVLKLKDLEDEIANAEESINKLKEQARILSQIEIPIMMQEMHITKLKLKDGESVEVKPFYSASIVPEVQEQAFTWLRNNGLGDIIKNDITVTFGRGEDNKAAQYAVLARGQVLNQSRRLVFMPRHSRQWSESVSNLDRICPLIYLKRLQVTKQK
jgi:hypothetical protein